MNLSELFIRRPIMTTLVMVGVVIFGVMSYPLLPISNLPNVDYPTIQVSAQRPGSSPETMADSVTRPLEKQFSTIASLTSLSSTSASGTSQITLQFDLDRNLDDAAQDVEAAIAAARGQIPNDLPNPPSYRKVNPADQPILYLYLTSSTLPLTQVDEYAETLVAQRLSVLPGVAQVEVYGAQKAAVRAQMNPSSLASYGISLDQVQAAIQAGNVDLPTGSLSGPTKSATIEINGQLAEAQAYRSLVVAYRNGAPVYLDQLGNVINGVQDDQSASWYNDTPAIVLTVQRQPGSNTVQVVDSIQALLPKLQGQIPGAVEINTLYDASQAIRASVADVEFTLALTVALVVSVIFLFLHNFWATLIPSLALPVSLVGTFAMMYLLGYSLDTLSLLALTLSVGFVVDDAIVMLENIVRHLEQGEPPLEAAHSGSREISFTILSMTLSLVAVFIPMLFLGGLVGRLFREFAVTIAVAILVSGFVSLTLTPMLCSRFLRTTEHLDPFSQTAEALFARLVRAYDWSLKLCLRYHVTTLIIAGAMAAGTVVLFLTVPKGFIPSEDTGQLTATTQGSQAGSFAALVRQQKDLVQLIRQNPAVAAVNSNVEDSYNGSLLIRLKPLSQRTASADQILEQLRRQALQVVGLTTFLSNPPVLPVGSQTSPGAYQFTIQSPDVKQLYHYAPLFLTQLQQLPQLRDVTSDLRLEHPEVEVRINRDQAASLGISAQEVESTLRNAYGTYQVSTIYGSSNEYQVILELEPQYQLDPASLGLLYVSSTSGTLVPLNTFAQLIPRVGPLTVNHFGQTQSATISFNLPPEVSLDQATQAIDQVRAQVLPSTLIAGFQGAAQVFQDSFQGLGLLLGVAVLVIYLVLGVLYEDFLHPLTILSGLPSAGFGALLALEVLGLELDVYSFIGIILLVGIVKKNGIMMVDFALEAQRNQHQTPAQAMYEACLVRFRPIMMTTMAALMGTLPIALGWGAGAEARRPLGVAVVGGLLFSQLVTLYLTPVVYTYLESWRQSWVRSNPSLQE